MTTYMNNLVNKAKIFGNEAKFIWTPAEVQTILVPLQEKPSDRRVREQNSVDLLNGITLVFRDPNAINIYFAGWIQHPTDGPSQHTLAWTIDPGHAGQGFFAFDRPFILVNDGDWNTGVHIPAQTGSLYLEHEIGHYLLREDLLNVAYFEQTQQSQKALYDFQGHFIAWPSSVNTTGEKQMYRHLMKAGEFVPLFPELDPLSKEDARDRFYDNRWNEP